MSDPADFEQTFLNSPQVRRRYGGVSDMTLWRWRHDAGLNFPQSNPIRGRHYWKLADLEAWDRERGQCSAV